MLVGITAYSWNVFFESCDTLSDVTELALIYIDFLTKICISIKLMEMLPADSTLRKLDKEKKKTVEDGDTFESK